MLIQFPIEPHCHTRNYELLIYVQSFLNKFIYLFLAVLGLRCYAWAFSSCGEWGLLFVAVHGLLIGVASLVAERGLQGARSSVVVARRLSSCGSWAQLLHGMWDFPGPGLESMSPTLAGGFLTTAPPGKSLVCVIFKG